MSTTKSNPTLYANVQEREAKDLEIYYKEP